MMIHLSAQKAVPANYCVSKDSGVNSDKAEKLSSAIAQVFQGHTAKFGSKTLMSIAYCWAA